MRESTPAAPGRPAAPEEGPTVELRILQQAASGASVEVTSENPYGLKPDPIPPEWMLEGNPTARRKYLVGSSDNLSSTYMWDCTAGRFNWHYDGDDEVIYVVEGSVVVEDEAGMRRRLETGDTFLFPAESTFHWTVPHYIRKIAFMRAPLSRKMRLAKAIYNFLTLRRMRHPKAPTGLSST
ncbi:MAG: cupin domain-containing protein [Steroidobacteraceae bacterium]